MSRVPLELPTIQNWSCHNCGGCCRQHAIYVTAAEEQRITAQKWTDLPNWPSEKGLFVEDSPGGKKRLATRDDGACVFLDEQGLCRIHGRFGEPAKPLACQIYPYAFHPLGDGLTVSLRFSCPSVVKNLGRSVASQEAQLRELADQVLPEKYQGTEPPELVRGQKVCWPDFIDCVDALDAMLTVEDVPLVMRLRRILAWCNLLESAPLAHLLGEKLTAMMELLYAECEQTVTADSLTAPSVVGQRLFRLAAGQYARHDTLATKPTWRMRWNFFWSGVRFARGTGMTPALHRSLGAVPISRLNEPFGPLTDEMDALLTRYLRVKVQGLHLCGRAAYGESLIDGMRTMVFVVSVMMWIARWVSCSKSPLQECVDDRLLLDDVIEAITIVDHNHAYSPAFGTASALSRVRMLNRLGDLERLLVWALM